MKDEREFILLMKLIECPFDNRGILKTKKAGSKKDFENYFEYNDKNKEFRKWFSKLLEEGVLYYVRDGNSVHGQLIKLFAVDKKKAYDRLDKLSSYRVAIDFFAKRAVLGAIEEKP